MLGQVAQAESSPYKTFLFVFLIVARKFGRIKNFAPLKAQGSRMPLVRAVYRGLLKPLAGTKGTIPWSPNHYEGAELLRGRRTVLTMPQVLQCSIFTSERPQVRTWGGRQTCFLPRAPSNLVTPLAVIRYSSGLSMYTKWGVARLHSYSRSQFFELIEHVQCIFVT